MLAAVQGVIGVLLNSSLDPAALPRVPVRPTHSRHNSYQDIALADLSMLTGSSAGPSSAASSFGGAVVQQQSASAPNSPLSVIYSSSQVRLLLLSPILPLLCWVVDVVGHIHACLAVLSMAKEGTNSSRNMLR